MKVAYIFKSNMASTFQLATMILPQLEQGNHGVEVAGRSPDFTATCGQFSCVFNAGLIGIADLITLDLHDDAAVVGGKHDAICCSKGDEAVWRENGAVIGHVLTEEGHAVAGDRAEVGHVTAEVREAVDTVHKVCV